MYVYRFTDETYAMSVLCDLLEFYLDDMFLPSDIQEKVTDLYNLLDSRLPPEEIFTPEVLPEVLKELER